jgi:hypothetical protein
LLFFQKCISVLEKRNFGQEQIHNDDETGISTVSNPSIDIATKGNKQVGSVISVERGVNVNLIACINDL